jgi:hypothetical protein
MEEELYTAYFSKNEIYPRIRIDIRDSDTLKKQNRNFFINILTGIFIHKYVFIKKICYSNLDLFSRRIKEWLIEN